MQRFERPKFKVVEKVESKNYGKFVISPLERDYIIGFITEELEKQQKALEEAKAKK